MTLLDLLTGLLGMGPKLDQIIALLQELKQQGATMSAELDRLTQSVASEGDAVAAVEQAIAGLNQQVKDLAAGGGTAQQFTDLANQIDAYKTRLAQAVVANTPAQPGGGGGTPAQPPAGAQAGTVAGRPHPHPHGGKP